jgi:UDP-2,4-diacetamido-2,4,6-trideoxy-beta-L-altropyranose hydrolase
MMPKAICFRLDAAGFLGYGHLMQSLTLADAFKKEEWTAHFVVKAYEEKVSESISSRGHAVYEIPASLEESEDFACFSDYTRKNSCQIAVIDHHDFDSRYTSSLRHQGVLVVNIDDEGTREFSCDILVNYNIYADSINYKVEPNTHMLLGPRYAILRKEFERDTPDVASDRKRLLVLMGGGYARGEVLKVANALLLLPETVLECLKPMLILGPGYPNPEAVLREFENPFFEWIINPENMWEIMNKSAFAICGAGGTLYELSRMGVPGITIVLDNNQKQIAKAFENAGITQDLGWYENVTKDKIIRLVLEWLEKRDHIDKRRNISLKLVDGKGTIRILDAILTSSIAKKSVNKLSEDILTE